METAFRSAAAKVHALWNIAKQIDNENDKLLVTRTWKGGGADAEPFYEKGIQTLYFVTTNSYKHLHMLSDKPETLNQNLFEAITKLAFLTITNFANSNLRGYNTVKRCG